MVGDFLYHPAPFLLACLISLYMFEAVMISRPLRVLVVDDSALYRKFVKEALSGEADIEVIGTAHHGQAALERIIELRPDLITLDVDMPELDGLGVLAALQERQLSVGVIICSALTSDGAATTLKALSLGAFDFVIKPSDQSTPAESYSTLRQQLLPKVRQFSERKTASAVTGAEDVRRTTASLSPRATTPLAALADSGENASADVRRSTTSLPPLRPGIVVIGISTGGPAALDTMLPELPADLGVPVVVVQHMPPVFTRSMANDLNQKCKLPVAETFDMAKLRPNNIWIAAGGKQTKVEFVSSGMYLRVTDDAPENNCRPSVDYLFRSVADQYGGRALGVIMTGMGNDGTAGCQLLRQCNASVIAQNAASCTVYGMPRSIIENKLATQVLPLREIAAGITSLVKGGVPCR